MHFYHIVYAIFGILLSIHLQNVLCVESDSQQNQLKSDLEKINKLKELLKLNKNLHKLNNLNDFDGGVKVENDLASKLNDINEDETDEENSKLYDQLNTSDELDSAYDKSLDESRRSAYLRFGKRNQAYLRFGRGQAYLRFGKRSQPAYLRFGRNPAYLRFGRSDNNLNESN